MTYTKRIAAAPRRPAEGRRVMRFIVHCVMCGKSFSPDEPAVCGGTINGRPICEQTRLQRELDDRLKPAADARLEAALVAQREKGDSNASN